MESGNYMNFKNFKTLKDVQKYLNSIPNINCGGCGYSALAMYEWLKKNKQLEKDTKIVYLYSFRGERGVPNHAVLYHKGKYLDSNGKYKVYRDFPTKQMRKKDVKDSFFDSDWNSMFNRNKYVPLIEKKLGITLE